MTSGLLAILVLVNATSFAAIAQTIPKQDGRDIDIPGTNTHYPAFEFRSLAEWNARKSNLRTQILAAAGLNPMPPRTPLNPHIFGRLDRAGFTVEKVFLETLPGYYLGGNLFRPARGAISAPGILVAHGHFAYGRLEHQPLYDEPTLAANLAMQGYVVFTYDMVGYNDTLQTPHDFGSPREDLWSFGPLALQLWNSTRALDFLASLPGVDPSRLAMTGASGGGTQTFLLAAIDDRVRYSAVVNMVSAEMQGGGDCENAPGLRIETNNVEIASMMAPRPMLLVSTTGDWTHNVPHFEFPIIQRIYDLFGARNLVSNAHFDFPHNYNHESRLAAYAFFRDCFQPGSTAQPIAEKEVAAERLQDVLVFEGRPLPPNAKDFDEIFRYWREQKPSATLNSTDLKALLQSTFAVETPARVLSEASGKSILLSREGKLDRVPAFWLPLGNAVTLVVDPQGSEAAMQSALVHSLRTSGGAVLAIDAFQCGAAKTKRGLPEKHYLTFNRSDDANRVQDILTALAFLKATNKPIHLVGIGEAAIWCLFAAAVSDIPVQLDSRAEAFTGSDDQFLRQFFVPGIQRAGGIDAALTILRNQTVIK